MAIFFRTLQSADFNALLKFEIENRLWFERFVDPRPNDFYSNDGILEHVKNLLASYAMGRTHPCVVLDDDGSIVARANLYQISEKKRIAEVGCRVAEYHSSRGVASHALSELIHLARHKWKLERLIAFVADENEASMRVLAKCGFARSTRVKGVVSIGGVNLSGYKFTLDL